MLINVTCVMSNARIQLLVNQLITLHFVQRVAEKSNLEPQFQRPLGLGIDKTRPGLLSFIMF